MSDEAWSEINESVWKWIGAEMGHDEARKVFARAIAAARAEGFAAAREMAARRVESSPPTHNRNDHAERIRAMQDGQGREASAAPNVCLCGHGLEWHWDGKRCGCMKKMPEDGNGVCLCPAFTPAT